MGGNTNFTKLPLSGGTADGRRIKVTATSDPATVIHTGPTDPTVTDEIWLDAYNSSASAVALTIEWGGNTAPDDLIQMMIPPQSGLLLVVPGNVLVGNATPLTIKAFAGTFGVLTIGGYVNRMQ